MQPALSVDCVLAGADVNGRNIIQELVRVFDVKRLATAKLHDAKRHQLLNDCGGAVGDQLSERQLTRKLVKELKSDGGTRVLEGRVDEDNFTDVDQFEKYLRCKPAKRYRLTVFRVLIHWAYCSVPTRHHYTVARRMEVGTLWSITT